MTACFRPLAAASVRTTTALTAVSRATDRIREQAPDRELQPRLEAVMRAPKAGQALAEHLKGRFTVKTPGETIVAAMAAAREATLDLEQAVRSALAPFAKLGSEESRT